LGFSQVRNNTFFSSHYCAQICGDYLLSKTDSESAISLRNFASSVGDARVLAKVDAFIQDHLLEVSEQEDFLKLPRLKVRPPRPRRTHLIHTGVKHEPAASFHLAPDDLKDI